jgi:NAD+ diphosphatase
MIQEIAPHVFDNAFKALDPEPGDYVLHYAANASWTGADSMRVHGKGMLAQERDGDLVLPKLADYARKPSCVYLFSIDDKRFFLATDVLVEAKGSFRYLSVSGCRFYEPRWLAFAAITGYQLWDWRQHNRYCGACAAPLVHAPRSRELVCPSCGNIVYPRINIG